MTEGKLKQEAEEYVKKLFEGTEFEDDDMDVCAYTKREMLEAILYFAEPREKLIAELEAQIEKMKYALNKIIETVHNDNISSYGERLVKIYDISCEVLQEIKEND